MSHGPEPIPELHKALSPSPFPPPTPHCAGGWLLEEDLRANLLGTLIWNGTARVKPREPWVCRQVLRGHCGPMGRLLKLFDIDCQIQG